MVAGIENENIFEVDKSKDTNEVSAYMVGIGPCKRIVLWDTIIKQLPTDQILFVVGHEMGHYVLNHIWWFLLYFSVFSFLIFYLIYKLSKLLVAKYHARFGFKNVSSIASLPLLLLLTQSIMFISSPISNLCCRYQEHEADRFGLELLQNNPTAAKGFVTVQMKDLINPYPGTFYKIFMADHPPLGERVAFCNTYSPWSQGQPLKYADKIHEAKKP